MKLEFRELAGRPRLAVAAIAVALAVGLPACGSDDDGGDGAKASDGADVAGASQGGDGAAGEDSGAAQGGKPAGPEGEVRAAFAAFVDPLYEGKFEQACTQITAAERKALKRASGLDCPIWFLNLFGTRSPQVEQKPKIVKLRVVGDKAFLRSKSIGSSVRAPIQFARGSDGWKLSGGLSNPPKYDKPIVQREPGESRD